MKTQTIDVQTLLGFVSATGLPAVFKAIIAFLHPSLYTLVCGQGFSDTAPSCYADEKLEAILWLVLSALAVAYGAITLWQRLAKNPTPPAGTQSAVIPQGQIPVTIDKDGVTGLASAKAMPGATQAATQMTSGAP